MPAVSRLGDLCTGHECYPPRPSMSSSEDVFGNDIGVVRFSDLFEVHCCDGSCHDGTVSEASPTVFVNDLPLARVGDMISCGSAISQGSENIFSG